LFVAEEIDGQEIDNSISATRRAGVNRGLSINLKVSERAVPAKPMKVKLIGTHQTGAPIQEIVSRMAGNFFSVEGVVDFDPTPGGDYEVRGELSKDASTVWIEDARTHLPVTNKVTTAKS
jgi:hypothetical protein